ncbi:diguanylate cyclase [Sulfurimonas sp. ST-27]|uniref:sensor domain-containing diguanylate cyclase n=1 Tax=Sulfurimonas sp. ST-27 TaxID=3400152 RepID=UPI003AB5EA3F
MKNSKNKFFMIGITILLVWVFIEAYFYMIAVEAQKNYTDNLLKDAREHYEEIENIRNLPAEIGTFYVKEGDAFKKVDPSLLVQTLLKQYQTNDFYYTVTPKVQKKGANLSKKPIYRLESEKKRLYYVYKEIAIDIDASFYVEKIQSVWFKFFAVSFLFTVFTLVLLFLIRFLQKKSSSYERLSNTLELKVLQQTKLLEAEHAKKEIYLETLFEKSPNIIIITTGNSITRANEAFFKFFKEYASLEEFKREHECICDFFCASCHGDTINSTKMQWVEDVLGEEEPIIKICYLEQEYYFSVYAKKIYEENKMHMMVTLNDITEIYNIRHKFEDLSMQDALTNIYNRRYFNVVFPQELNRAKRTRESFCFAIMDVDNFKLYNDNYGHDAGDEALQSITAKITELTQRANEFFFRLGGEEFGFVCSAYTKEEAFRHLQNICKEVQNLKIEHLYNEKYGVLTISIGVCYLSDAREGEVKYIYKSADNALYKAKESGRNKVVLFENC